MIYKKLGVSLPDGLLHRVRVASAIVDKSNSEFIAEAATFYIEHLLTIRELPEQVFPVVPDSDSDSSSVPVSKSK